MALLLRHSVVQRSGHAPRSRGRYPFWSGDVRCRYLRYCEPGGACWAGCRSASSLSWNNLSSFWASTTVGAYPCRHSSWKSLASISAQQRPRRGLPPAQKTGKKATSRGSSRPNSPRPRQLVDSPRALSRNSWSNGRPAHGLARYLGVGRRGLRGPLVQDAFGRELGDALGSSHAQRNSEAVFFGDRSPLANFLGPANLARVRRSWQG